MSVEEIVLEFQNRGLIVDLSINTFGLKIHEKGSSRNERIPCADL